MYESTKEMVDSQIERVDGSAVSKDPSAKRRWRSHNQTAATLIWNDRFWQFKVAQAVISFSSDITAKNYLPDNFGSFETGVDQGVFAPQGKPAIKICFKSEMVAAKNLIATQTGDAEMACVNYDEGRPYLDLFPVYRETTNVTVVYLMCRPKLLYIEDGGGPAVDSGTDQLKFIPAQWREQIAWGGEWLSNQKAGSSVSLSEQEIWKAGLDEMRAREAVVIRRLAPWRPDRMRPLR